VILHPAIVVVKRSYVVWGFVIYIIHFVSYIIFQFKTADEEQCRLKKFAVMSKLVDKGQVSFKVSFYIGEVENSSVASKVNENSVLVKKK